MDRHPLPHTGAAPPTARCQHRAGGRTRPAARCREGLTVMELVIVMLILSIVAVIAAPRYAASLELFRVEAAAMRVAADLARARHAARVTGAGRTVQFDVALNQYTLVGVQCLNRPTADATSQLSKTGYPATLLSVAFNDTSQLTYDLHGRPWAGAPLAPLTTGSLVIQAGSRQRTIVIDPTTGKAQVQ